jgi:UDP-N-acetylglucosamine diphosphorylase/glucosamine-1-phosphate N-acetyltransferase
MNVNFFDSENIASLYPLTLTRPAADLRVGICTIAEKWKIRLSANQFGYITSEHLSKKFIKIENADLLINGHLLPNDILLKAVLNLKSGQALYQGDLLLASNGQESEKIEFENPISLIQRPFEIFKLNHQEIISDFDILSKNRTSATLSNSNKHFGKYPIFLEDGAVAECATFNTNDGPIYLGKNTEVMEGSIVRGPLAMCEGSKLKLGTKVYGATTLGPFCNVGGEVNNIVLHGYSNKGHDGFLGNAVLGEWCNIGADTNCSNLKNTYEEVKIWNYASSRFERSGQQFCGLIMGDHSKCGINTMFNTGTVVGVACNLFGAGFPRQFIPDFSWGGASGFVPHQMPAVEKTAKLVMVRRNKEFNEIEQSILHWIYDHYTPTNS